MTTKRVTFAALLALAACGAPGPQPAPGPAPAVEPSGPPTVPERLAKYTTVRLTADLSRLTERERQMIPLLIDAGREMDAVFWIQAYGDRQELLASIEDPETRQFAEINYGPWDRLANDEPFIPGTPAKAPGANFYPRDMTREEFERAVAGGGARADSLRSLYTLVRRDPAGRLVAIPYSIAFRPYMESAAAKLREAARLAEDPGLRRYLELLAVALMTDQYRGSDVAWLRMTRNNIDVIMGPVETYEDALYGYKAAHEAYVLIKDQEWSRRLARFVSLLPGLQRGLPVPEEFRRETPGSSSQLGAYDAVYYAGQANAGSKTIAVNLPNDEQVQLQEGTRRLQLKNTMRAKFDHILAPIARELVVEEQLRNITFDAFFENVMFHEVAHGLGIKNTINNRGTVREALKERAGGLEEQKADVLGLYMITALTRQGELPQAELFDNYATFLAGLFRSVRFGASSAHGQANMATFNYFQERGAFTRDARTGKYRVDFQKMQDAVNTLSERILRLQGTGDYEGVGEFLRTQGVVGPQLRGDLERLSTLGIPVDVVFEQGMSVLTGGE